MTSPSSPTSAAGRLVFFDLETTGREPGLHKILQFAGIAVDARTLATAEELDVRVTLHAFDDAWDVEALKNNVFAQVTGYTGRVVQVTTHDGRPAEYVPEPERQEFLRCVDIWNKQPGIKVSQQALSLIDAFLNRHKSVIVVSKRNGTKYLVARLAGHNVHAFDIPHMRAWYGARFFPAEYRCLDTFHLAAWVAWMETGVENVPLNLPALRERYGIKVLGAAHDALVDVRATVELARRLLFRLTQFRMPYDRELVLDGSRQ